MFIGLVEISSSILYIRESPLCKEGGRGGDCHVKQTKVKPTCLFSFIGGMLLYRLFAGYNKAIRVFDVHRPGRDFEQYSLHKGIPLM
jgi:hypothetical protein